MAAVALGLMCEPRDRRVLHRLSTDCNYRASVPALDDLLARAEPTDLWFQEASRLRAVWRIMRPDPANQRQDALDAIALIDRTLFLFPDPLSFLTRLDAAVAADRRSCDAE